jgi:hypothetical protein
MLGTNKSRGHCAEMICANVLADANLGQSEPRNPLLSMTRCSMSCQKIKGGFS